MYWDFCSSCVSCSISTSCRNAETERFKEYRSDFNSEITLYLLSSGLINSLMLSCSWCRDPPTVATASTTTTVTMTTAAKQTATIIHLCTCLEVMVAFHFVLKKKTLEKEILCISAHLLGKNFLNGIFLAR